MFMAQTGEETDHYNTFSEYVNADGTNGWCGGYSGGCRYRGRGAIQLTHDYNYKACGQALGVGTQFYDNPDIVATPQWAWRTAGWYWKGHNLNNCADSGDVVACTKIINGGTNGLSVRQQLYTKARSCLGQPSPVDDSNPVPVNNPNPVSAPASCKVNADGVRLRSDPCTASDCTPLATLNTGTSVTKTGQTEFADGYTWAEVSSPRTGWIASQFLTCSGGSRESAPSSGQAQDTPVWVWAVCGVAGVLVLLVLVLGVLLVRVSKKPAEERF